MPAKNFLSKEEKKSLQEAYPLPLSSESLMIIEL
jgi:hypothetical protein